MEDIRPIENKNFIDNFIEEDLAAGGRFEGKKVHTRFPPEPNGYLHIGHCKALTIDFGTAEKFGGLCNLRMDDTNPTKGDTEYVDAIQADIHWLGFDWGDRFFYGSDYFEKDYEYAVELIKKGLAYVCDLTPEQAREYRGDIGKPAISPYRDRDVEENLDLFERMKNGEFPEGSRTLRAKIDLASGNFNMRDLLFTASATCTITVRATSGASIRCTTSRTRFRTHLRASRTPCARLSLRTTVRCTSGWLTTVRCRIIQAARVCPPECNAHGHVQALSAPARVREAR